MRQVHVEETAHIAVDQEAMDKPGHRTVSRDFLISSEAFILKVL